MRIVLQVGMCCWLAVTAWAQRGGGGHGGGMGGGMHASMGGGGMRGGGYSGGAVVRGGGGSVGLSHGGYAGGAYHGGYAGGGIHTGYGGYYGYGGHYGYGHYGYGYGHGYYGSAFYVGFGLGYPYYGYYGGYPYYGYPYYGYPYVGGYWPGYSDYYPYDNGYSYSAPATTVVYPTAAASPSVQAAPVSGGYDQYGQQTRPGGTAALSSPIYLFAFQDHTIRAAASYWVDGNTLHYVTLQHEERLAPLDSLDRSLTLQLNRERRQAVQLP